MNNKRFIASIAEIILGLALIVLGEMQMIDSFWMGMGTALIFVGVIYLVRQIRYKANTGYKEKVDTETKDERNRFLAMKAWSWTGYLLTLIFGVATIAFKLADQDTLMFFCSGSVCLIVTIYWVAYYILRRKY